MVTFTVNIKNWEKHNGGKKKNHRSFLLEYRFFEDEKVSQLRLIESSLYLKCLCIAADLMSDRFTIHAGLMPRRWRVDVKSLESCLKTLEQFQLLTYEKNESFLNTKEKKRKENNTIQENTTAVSEPEKKPDSKLPSTYLSKAQIRGSVPEFDFDPIFSDMLKNVTHSLQHSWLAAYPNAKWICHEGRKADVWMKANPKKAPKEFGRFFSNWLSKSFEDYRKGIPSNNQRKSFAQQAEDKALAMMEQFEAEAKEEKNAN